MKRLVFATRPSALARWQTSAVISALQARFPGLNCLEQVITTQGDRILDVPLPEIVGKGLFTGELETALLSGQVDCAVHSLKDLPVIYSPELSIACIPARGEVRDVLVSKRGYTLHSLPPGAVVGTSSLRRSAQLLHLRPDLTVASLRGNVDTRLSKALTGSFDAIILAGAGLVRLGLEASISEWLPLESMLPAPGQGALAVQCRRDDLETTAVLAALEDVSTRLAVTAERDFLLGLGGGCAMPVAACASLEPAAHLAAPGSPSTPVDLKMKLTGMVASPDGKRLIRMTMTAGSDADIGLELARQALLQGAGDILNWVPSQDSHP